MFQSLKNKILSELNESIEDNSSRNSISFASHRKSIIDSWPQVNQSEANKPHYVESTRDEPPLVVDNGSFKPTKRRTWGRPLNTLNTTNPISNSLQQSASSVSGSASASSVSASSVSESVSASSESVSASSVSASAFEDGKISKCNQKCTQVGNMSCSSSSTEILTEKDEFAEGFNISHSPKMMLSNNLSDDNLSDDNLSVESIRTTHSINTTDTFSAADEFENPPLLNRNNNNNNELIVEKTREIMRKLANSDQIFNAQYGQIMEVEINLQELTEKLFNTTSRNKALVERIKTLEEKNKSLLENNISLESKIKKIESINKNYIDTNTLNRVKYSFEQKLGEKEEIIEQQNQQINELYNQVEITNTKCTEVTSKYGLKLDKMRQKFRTVNEVNKQMMKNSSETNKNLSSMNSLLKKLEDSKNEQRGLNNSIQELRAKINHLSHEGKKTETELIEQKELNKSYHQERHDIMEEYGHFFNDNEKNQSFGELTKCLVIRLQYTKNVIIKVLCTNNLEHKLHYLTILSDLCSLSDRELATVRKAIQQYK